MYETRSFAAIQMIVKFLAFIWFLIGDVVVVSIVAWLPVGCVQIVGVAAADENYCSDDFDR